MSKDNSEVKDTKKSNDIYFNIVGTDFCYGDELFDINMIVYFEKETDNEYDHEAIKVIIPGLGKVGYVANSTRTVLGECYSAGRLYDKLKEDSYGIVKYVTGIGIICLYGEGEIPDLEVSKPKKRKELIIND